jgi:hypothetical protein
MAHPDPLPLGTVNGSRPAPRRAGAMTSRSTRDRRTGPARRSRKRRHKPFCRDQPVRPVIESLDTFSVAPTGRCVSCPCQVAVLSHSARERGSAVVLRLRLANARSGSRGAVATTPASMVERCGARLAGHSRRPARPARRRGSARCPRGSARAAGEVLELWGEVSELGRESLALHRSVDP